MCGLFGFVKTTDNIKASDLQRLALNAENRGQDSSGFMFLDEKLNLSITKADYRITRILKPSIHSKGKVFLGHSRLVTHGMSDNQPIGDSASTLVFHNGIVLNKDEIFGKLRAVPKLEIDTEGIQALANQHMAKFGTLRGVAKSILEIVDGAASCFVVAPQKGELVLFSNTGSMYSGNKSGNSFFSSESAALRSIGADQIEQVIDEKLFCFPPTVENHVSEIPRKRVNLLFDNQKSAVNDAQFNYEPHDKLQRCTTCILPETMPFIQFSEKGECNFCENYKTRLKQKSPEAFLEMLETLYFCGKERQVLIPFSGGRDSSFALHLATQDLGLKAVAYSYDWGMITDVGRRNMSRMTSKLGVEHIIVAADIEKKRKNVRKNLLAWAARPDVSMLGLLTAGDKHFYKYVTHVQKKTRIDPHLWGVNPLETTHFKAGFLGVPPDFESTTVYRSGLTQQIPYHLARLGKMLGNPRYLNSSLVDTYSGEYYRSIRPKKHYFHLFDFFEWNETKIDHILSSQYGWEVGNDNPTSWRNGDGTAAFYNFVYHYVAGFSEHDTLRSNQVREGQISREEALKLVERENRPQSKNINWYLQAVGVNPEPIIKAVLSMKRMNFD